MRRWGLAILGLFLVLWGGSVFRAKYNSWSKGGTPNSSATKSSGGSSWNAPTEVLLREICMCESRCQQFEPDGKTPLKNKGIPEKGIKPSSAFGKYQFMEFHRGLALELGYDLNTEAGQDGYAKYRIERYGTADWEFDAEYGGGPACWGPRLASLGYVRTGVLAVARVQRVVITPAPIGTVDAPVDEWSGEVNTAGHRKVCWGRIDTSKGGACKIMMDKDPKKVFSIGTSTRYAGLKIVQFKCSEVGARVEVLSSN